MTLTKPQKQHLRALAYRLKPVVILGQAGLSEAVCKEIGLALEHHELIKVRVNAADRDERRTLIDDIGSRTGAELVQSIGHVAVLFRRNREKPRVKLPQKA